MTEHFPPIISSLLQENNVTDTDRMLIAEHLNFISLKRGEHFSKSGKICDRLGILIDGLLFANFSTPKGRLNVSRFFYAPQNIIVTSFDSFKNQNYSSETITALESSSVLYFTNKGLKQLTDEVPVIDKIIRHFAEVSYISALQRIHDLQVLSAKERVHKFFKHNHELYNKVNKMHIASYLRVHRNDLTTFVKELNAEN